jgi:hypothetical protein
MPARAEPTANVNEMVLFTLMPMRRAAPMSSDTARMALPSLVFCTRIVSTMVEMAVTTMVMMAFAERDTPPTLDCRGRSKYSGTTLASAPKTSCAPFSRKYETPMAVMSRLMRGASRSGW